ncbi:hypothetical protein C8N32_10199 [Rhodovulum imhoffii]|uniref:Uncharacterized protein n=1 Tax=Rhodovulum imhoffii TaxID=365340 RepID=A0A2T5BW88_9RHOB|nr:hypothetical protein C8N32_10199 [Rhodovulum imhoffii]
MRNAALTLGVIAGMIGLIVGFSAMAIRSSSMSLAKWAMPCPRSITRN